MYGVGVLLRQLHSPHVHLGSQVPQPPGDPVRVLRPQDQHAPDQPPVGDVVKEPPPSVPVPPAVARGRLAVWPLHELARPVLVVPREAEAIVVPSIPVGDVTRFVAAPDSRSIFFLQRKTVVQSWFA